ncbi:MAG TPA: LptA/OstA family protein [Opitutaceae bacterium]|nr:LptA/OstA family protein [Opitutaceae bacterium]
MRPMPLLAAALALAGPARAADAPSTTVECSGLAESVSSDTETTTTFNDRVVAAGNEITLHCDHLKVVTTGIGDKGATIARHDRFKYLLATGNVRIVQGDRVATCGRAEVFPGEDRIVLTENPVVKIESEHYEASGPRMILYRGQRRAVIEGTPANPSHILLPGIKDLGFRADKAAAPEKGAPQGPPPK